MSLTVPPLLQTGMVAAALRWERERGVERLWARDAELWTGSGEDQWLGWLEAPTRAPLEELDGLRQETAAEGIRDVLLLGMGGSSLAPEVLGKLLAGRPETQLHVLDSTDPDQVRGTVARVDLERGLVLVSSKSGTTMETARLADYLLDRLATTVGQGRVGSRCLAITDPGSALEELARAYRFRQVWHGESTIGGRFSALSNFGLVPAAVTGLNVRRLVAEAQVMAAGCGPEVPVTENPGLRLGLLLGVAAQMGRDKVTLVLAPELAPLGWWVEQLVAESTGKAGQGVIPIVDESLGTPDVYAQDRVFVYVRDGADDTLDKPVAALAAAGHPVASWTMSERVGVAAEFFRWEIATAVCGAVLDVNPFDQPDVEASKVESRKLMRSYEEHGNLPATYERARDGAVSVIRAAERPERADTGRTTVEALISAHLALLGPGDYFALLLYLRRDAETMAASARIRTAVREGCEVATVVGFGPRFLHSIGQLFKGGPDSGVFLQVTIEEVEDVPIPDHPYSFGVVQAAQAQGDAQVLEARGRRLLRVQLTGDVDQGLRRLESLIVAGLAGRQ